MLRRVILLRDFFSYSYADISLLSKKYIKNFKKSKSVYPVKLYWRKVTYPLEVVVN